MSELTINPYADWDRFFWENNPVNRQEAPATRLHPVYIELKRNDDGGIDADVIDAMRTHRNRPDATVAQGGQYHLDALAENMLRRLEAKPSDPMAVARYGRIFIFRATKSAYQDADAFTVLHVGSAFPQDYTGFLNTQPQNDMVAANEGIAGSSQPDKPKVLTAIIDDFIGLANTRFSYLDDTGVRKTRIQKAWLQETPFATGNDGRIFVGQTLSRNNINERLSAATRNQEVDETTFYSDLYKDGQIKLIDTFSPDLQQANLRFWMPQDQVMPYTAAGLTRDTQNEPLTRRPVNFGVTHGTHVLDLAAGLPMETADDSRPILAVQLPPLATAETSGSRLEHMILAGLLRILNWADDTYSSPAPVVINLSYVLQAGPKNGHGFLEQEFDRLITLRNAQGFPTKLVLPTGNGYRSKSRAVLDITGDAPGTIDWRLLPCDQSSNFLEIWAPKDADLTVQITMPDNAPVKMAALAANTPETIEDANGRPVGRSYAGQRSDMKNWTIALAPTINHAYPRFIAPAGAYAVEIQNKSGGAITVEVEVQRDDTPRNYRETGYQSYLDHPLAYDVDPDTLVRDFPAPEGPITREGTLSSLATVSIPPGQDKAKHVLVVGGAFDRDARCIAAPYAASGPTQNGRKNPDTSAISDETRAHRGRLASGTFSGSAASVSGTSVAAPIVTRRLVDDMESALTGRAVPADKIARLGQETLPLTPAPGRMQRREWHE